MKISTLIHEAHSIACDKGWHEKPVCRVKGAIVNGEFVRPQGVDVDRVARLLLMIHTEIGEAWECYQNNERDLVTVNGKPEGLIAELADVAIRVGDLAGALGLPRDVYTPQEWGSIELGDLDAKGTAVEQEHFGVLRWCVDKATEHLRVPSFDSELWLMARLTTLLAECQRMATYFDLDLTEAVRVKLAYNRTRPHRHGGKAL